MISFLKILKLIVSGSLIFLLINIQAVYGEGTKQLEPTNPATTPDRRTRLMFDQTGGTAHRTPFAVVGCAERYRLNVYINDPTTEQIYFGFNDGANTIYYQIKDPDGIVVSGFSLAQIPSSGLGFITTWDQAFAGPKIGTINPAGYDPKILTPTKTGNYYIEFAKQLSGGSFSGQDMLYFDISVVQGITVKNGRLWSKAWQLSDDASGDLVKSYPAKLYVYSDDGIVTALNINEWNGGTYTTYCNQWGVTNTQNWAIDRMSDNDWPGSDLPQYKIFLNNPDIAIFPTGEFGQICEVKSHPYCDGSVDILARVNKPGSLTLNMDIAPSGPGPEDVVLNGSINGSAACDVWDTITWNGLDGTGAPVQNGTSISIDIDYLNGLTNLPLWDVEDNASGMIVNIIRPIPMFSSKLPVFWDDSNLPGGNVNDLNGCIYPTSTIVTGCHSWSSQNENMINTWWYLSEGSTNLDIEVIRSPQADFSYINNCSGSATEFTDVSLIPGGYPTAWHWDFGLFGDTSNIQNPVITFPNAGTFNVHLRVTSDNGCYGDKFKPVTIYPSPVANAGNDKLIPFGTNTSIQGSASGGSGSYSYHWEPAAWLVDPSVSNPITLNLSETTDFTLTVTDLDNSCQQSDIMTVTIIGGPLVVQLNADPTAVCPNSTSTINAVMGGGSGAYSYVWTSDPAGFSSTLEDITVQPAVTTTYTLVASDGFSTLSKSITIIVHPLPVVVAGAHQTIPYGTSTLLSGSASSGLPPYSFSWSPSNLVVSPTSGTTATLVLSATTNFTLTAIDAHGCMSSEYLLVTISGGPLMVNPMADHSPICNGESTVLYPMSEGGSGDYTYSWSVNGVEFSTATDPIVTPTVTTTYQLVISDGYTQITGDVTVLVNQLPVINLIPPGVHILNGDTIIACVFDTLVISAQNANSIYLWSNGATTPEIQSATSGLAFDMLTYSVDVTNTLSGCSNSGEITIMFTYGECSFGVPEGDGSGSIIVFPNPNHGSFTCRVRPDQCSMYAEIANLQGQIIRHIIWETSPGLVENLPVDLNSEPPGVYFLKVFDKDSFRIIRIVKI